MIEDSKQLAMRLPEYPKTPMVADQMSADTSFLLNSSDLVVEEKVDGASVGIMWEGDHPIVRNREHILKKGYIEKTTPAKMQFRPMWGWIYDNQKKFAKLNAAYGRAIGVYGEWCLALHGIIYDKLPDWLIAFALYDPDIGFLDPMVARVNLSRAGFAIPKLLHYGPLKDWEQVHQFASGESAFSTVDPREGAYFKSKRQWAKVIRPGYHQGFRWNTNKLTKQQLA